MRLKPISATSGRVARFEHSTKPIRQRSGAYALVFAIVLALSVLAAPSAQAQTFTLLHTFAGGATDGDGPLAGLIMDAKGNLYGTTGGGGPAGFGTVFKLSTTGALTVLHGFPVYGGTDGSIPEAGLVMDGKGNLYGTTAEGGDGAGCGGFGCGTVFRVSKNGKETVLHRFKGQPDGIGPLAGLIMDAKGDLYGTTNTGGTANAGTVFKVSKTGKETVLYSFKGQPDGVGPLAGLIMDAKGDLYGTTAVGGASNGGTVFKVTKTGRESVLYSFCALSACADGFAPTAPLAMDAKGTFYGTTEDGGTGGCGVFGCGTVFKLTKTGKETVLYSFTAVDSAAGGDAPTAGLVMDSVGNFYGTTASGGTACSVAGSGFCGVVFELTGMKETVLYTFTGGTDGAIPLAGLVMDAKGKLYGTTFKGGADNLGTVFSVVP